MMQLGAKTHKLSGLWFICWKVKLGRPPGEENGYPLQYSFLENPMDRGAWRATVHGVSTGQTWLSN